VATPPRQNPRGRGDGAPPRGEDNRAIRGQADRRDMVINRLGELGIAGAGAALLARQTRQGTLIEANAQIGRLIEEIRNGTLQLRRVPIGDRKSTRLNSSHITNSYAVFCLKKNTKNYNNKENHKHVINKVTAESLGIEPTHNNVK